MALLERVRSFAADKGPEFIGDFLGPVAKWSIFFANALLESNEEFKQVVSHVFGMSTQLVQKKPRTSPLRILISFIRSSSEEMQRDAKTMATLSIRMRSACTLSALVLLNVALMGGVDWKWVITFHLGMYVYNWGQVEAQARSGKDTLAFLASHTFLCMCDAVTTPATLICRFMVHMLGSVMVVCLGLRCDATFPCFVACTLVIWFYTPLWFGVCASLASYPLFIGLGDIEEPAFKECLGSYAVLGGVLCFVRMLLYVSSGAFCGAFLLFMVPWVLVAAAAQDNSGVDMAAPLPLLCALLASFYLPFWVGASFISTIVCSFALACCNNVLAIGWWTVSFATLHIVSSYTHSSRDFSVLTACLLGSFFSYGCILA